MSFLSKIVNFFWKRTNEEGSKEYGWSDLNIEKFTQFYFQLVRGGDYEVLEKQLNDLMYDETLLLNLYKLIGHTRDIINGKGERDLTYLQIYVWYQHYPILAKEALRFIVNGVGNHQFGCWKDIKYFCRFVLNRAKKNNYELYNDYNDLRNYEKLNENDKRLIQYAISLLLDRLELDYKLKKEGKIISLAGKWCPREKSSFGWLYHLIVSQWKPENFSVNVLFSKQTKAKMQFRKMLSELNNYLDTTQIKMCNKEWRKINFDKVTSQTLEKNKQAFLNLDHMNSLKYKDIDRTICRENLIQYLKNNERIKGSNNSIYKFVRDGIEKIDYEDIVNKQWNDNKRFNKSIYNVIPMVDVSNRMTLNKNIPLYNAVGLSIRLSECNKNIFKNKILTFSSEPNWIKFDENDNFMTKVNKVMETVSSLNANFYGALKMILNIIIENNISPCKVNNMTLAIFSSMNIDQACDDDFNTIYENIRKMYAEAGKNSIYNTPYEPPHILFWNLVNSDGFPCLSIDRNITMFSGYSPLLLNYFSEILTQDLKEKTPLDMVNYMLKDCRYDVLENIFKVMK